MSREIGYRAWHKEDKKMLHVCGMDWMVNLERDCIEISAVNCAERRSDGWVNGGSHDIEDVIIMQDTGIKDKNGVKIYEGDVINIRNIDGVFKIVFDEWLCGFYAVNYDYNDMRKNPKKSFSLMRAFEFFEVVGNIHEDKK